MMSLLSRDDVDEVHTFVSPYAELNAGLWSLYTGATIFFVLRLWVKVTKRHGLWYDDYILLVSWIILTANNALIVHQFRTGYILEDSSHEWDDGMHILINISSCGTLIGQALTKTAFGVTLLRMSKQWQRWVIWFCIITMNMWMFAKVILQWAKVCDKDGYQNWYRLDFCIGWQFRDSFKEGGNVYNIIMDFVFALFPWLITRSLEMRKMEKIGLCATMSLGMIVAIVSAIRVGWKDKGNERDAYYIWRNGLSQVWYSSEITGTIIVQCIPILRPIIRDIHNSLTSRKLESGAEHHSTAWSNNNISRKRTSVNPNHIDILDTKSTDRMELREIPEEPDESWKDERSSTSPSDKNTASTPSSSRGNMWPLSGPDNHRSTSFDLEQGGGSQSSIGLDIQPVSDQGLSPPPRR